MKLVFALILVTSNSFAAYNFKHCNPRAEGAGPAKEYEIQKDGTLSIPKELGDVVSKSTSATLDKIVVQAKDRAPGTHVYELHKSDGKPVRLVHVAPLFGDRNPQKSTLVRFFGYDRKDNCELMEVELSYNEGEDANKKLVTYQDSKCGQFVKNYKDGKITRCSQNYLNNCLDLASAACVENPSQSCSEEAKNACLKKLSPECSAEAKRITTEISDWDKSLKPQNRELFGYKSEELYVLEDPFTLAMNIASSCRYTKDFYSPEKKLWEVWKVFKKDHASGVDDGEDTPSTQNRGRDTR